MQLFEQEEASLSELWNNRLYDLILVRCNKLLSSNPMDALGLAYMGFSYFYKAVAEVTAEDKFTYLEESVRALRRAKLSSQDAWTKETDYVLGKAYYHKGKYYYDLSVRYLEQARANGHKAEDIYEYLGLAYTQLGEMKIGLEYFHLALDEKATDLLLLTIGQSYFQVKEIQAAEEYLIRAVNMTDDALIEKKSRFLLGQLYFEREDYFKAEREYLQILDLDAQSVNAHFYLGEIYQEMKDPVKARAQWRKALIIDPAHYGARLKYYK